MKAEKRRKKDMERKQREDMALQMEPIDYDQRAGPNNNNQQIYYMNNI